MARVRGEAAGVSKSGGAGAGSETKTAAEDAPSLDELAPGGDADKAAAYTGATSGGPRGGDPQAAVHVIEEKLSGLVVTDGEARAAVDALNGLAPADRARVWSAMGADSQARLLDNVDHKARGKLLDGLAGADVLQRCPKTTHPMATKESQRLTADPWGEPPAAPSLMAREAGMSKELLTAVHDENLSRAGRYRAQYDDYLGAYRDQVVLPAAKSNDIASIRRAGPPAPLMLPEREPGAPLGAPGRDEVNRADAWRKVSDPTQALVDVYGPINRAVHHARGELAAGELRFAAEVEGTLGSISVGVGGDIGQDGDSNVKYTPGLAVGKDSKTQPWDGERPARATVGVGLDDDKLTVGVGVGPAGAGVSVKPVGVDGEVSVVGVSASLGYAQVGADLEKGTVSVGAGHTFGVPGKASLGGKAMAEFKPFLAPEDIGLFRTDDGFFDIPHEVKSGVPWHKLSDERRADLERAFGWSAKEWREVSARKGDLQLAPRQLG